MVKECALSAVAQQLALNEIPNPVFGSLQMPGCTAEDCLAVHRNPVVRRFLRYHLFLSNRIRLFLDAGYSAEEIFWSRYFWFARAAQLESAGVVESGALGEHTFDILAHPFPECEVDWNSGRDVDAMLRAHFRHDSGEADGFELANGF